MPKDRRAGIHSRLRQTPTAVPRPPQRARRPFPDRGPTEEHDRKKGHDPALHVRRRSGLHCPWAPARNDTPNRPTGMRSKDIVISVGAVDAMMVTTPKPIAALTKKRRVMTRRVAEATAPETEPIADSESSVP